MNEKRTIFFLSDHTGITVENMGRALLSQFGELDYEIVHLPFIDDVEKARRVASHIQQVAQESALLPIIFSTLVESEVRECFSQTGAKVLDLFVAFTPQLEKELGIQSSTLTGQYHSQSDQHAYNERIHAVNFAYANDDGSILKEYPVADIILIGVSRSGKTPSCLFLGLQHGILAANYPLLEDDMLQTQLPAAIEEFKDKLFGLTINPWHLQRIRQERRPNSLYASLEQCNREVKLAEDLFKRHRIPYLDTTAMSIEEIAARLIHRLKIENPQLLNS